MKKLNKLILTHKGGQIWNWEIHQADAQSHLSAVEMLKGFRDEIDHIIKMLEKEAKNHPVAKEPAKVGP